MLYIIRGVDTIIVGSGRSSPTRCRSRSSTSSMPRSSASPTWRWWSRSLVGGRRLLPALVPLRAATCTRSAPTPRRRGWPASRSPSACSRRSCSAGRSPAWRGLVGDAVQHDRRHRRQRPRATGDRRGRGRRRGDLRRQRQRRRGRARRAPAADDQLALNVLGVPSIWTEAIAGLPAAGRDHPRPRHPAAAGRGARKRRVHLGA